MHIFKKLSFVVGAAVLAACATATPYQASQSANARNGFSEQQIETDRTRISFDGNSLTKRETVETYLLYRAAELTKQNGYDYFTLTQRETDKTSRIQSTGFDNSYYSPYYGMFDYSYFHPRHGWSRPRFRSRFHSRLGFYDPFHSGFGYDGWGGNFDTREITRYKASAEVKFRRGQKPSNADNAFNAQEVLDNLGSSIVYPEAKA